MDNMNINKQKLKKAVRNLLGHMDGQKCLILVCLGVLLLVIAIPTQPKDEENGKKEEKEAWEEETECDSDSYEERLEKRLEELLAAMDGVGEVKVMITLEDEGEKVLAEERKSQSSRKEEKKDGTVHVEETYSKETQAVMEEESPYETKEVKPSVRGVCVVAQGGSDDRIRVEIYKMVQALFDIEPHKISIVEMNVLEGS